MTAGAESFPGLVEQCSSAARASLPDACDVHAQKGQGAAVAEADDAALDLIAMVSAGHFTPPVCARLQRGFSSFGADDDDRPLSLECYLRLPRGKAARRRTRRNRWLLQLASEFDSDTPWGRAGEVSKALDDFLSRGPWQAWREEDDPPAFTSNLRTALFRVAKNNDGAGLSVKQVWRVIGHLY
jgi:hypothetical protein